MLDEADKLLDMDFEQARYASLLPHTLLTLIIPVSHSSHLDFEQAGGASLLPHAIFTPASHSSPLMPHTPLTPF